MLFKVCRCCGTYAAPRKRICPVCKVPAIWDVPTEEQVSEHLAEKQRRMEFIQKLMD